MPRTSSRLVAARLAAAALAGVLAAVLTACGGSTDPEASDTTTVEPATTSAETTSAEPSTEPAETSTSATSEPTTEAPNAVEVTVTIAANQVTASADRVPVSMGQTLRITVTSDVADELHVHGFDEEAELAPGQPTTLEIVVGTSPGPGLYEVETHESGLLLFQIEVS